MPKKTFVAMTDDLKNFIDIDDKTKLYIHKHAIRRLQSRNISMALIVDTFCNPDIIMPHNDFENARNYVKTFGNKRVKIGVKDKDQPLVLITAFIQQE